MKENNFFNAIFNKKKNCIKLVITDIDGVWTDGGMYYDQEGNELKKFTTYDGAGVVLCHQHNIPVAIITGENTRIVENRAKKLNVDYVFQGVSDKLNVAQKLSNKLGIRLDEIAAIGDDLGDYQLLKNVTISACPKNACKMVKKIVSIKLKKNGGEGVFREFCQWLIDKDMFFK